MTRKLDRYIAALAIGAILVAGCSGSDDATEPVTTEPVTTEPVTTEPVATDPEVTDPVATDSEVTDPVATDPEVTDPVATDPAATEPVATDPVGTDPVATDPAPTQPDTPEGKVVAAIASFEGQWKECLRTLPNCDPARASRRLGGNVSVETGFTVELWNGNGYTASSIDDLEYRVDEVTVSPDGNTAEATVCVTDPVQIAAPDGTPVNAAYLTSIEDYGLQLRDGEWFWVERTMVGDFTEGEENSVCV